MPKPTTLVRLLTSRSAPDRSDGPGAILPLPTDEARRYVEAGLAEYAGEAPPVDPPADPPAPEGPSDDQVDDVAGEPADQVAEETEPEPPAKPATRPTRKRGANAAKSTSEA